MIIILECLQRNRPTKHSTMTDMELKIRKWLSSARDWDGGRSRSGSAVSIPHDHDSDNEAGEPRN